jgi:hypothetical protein
MKRVKDEVDCATKQELLSIGYLLELFEEVTCLGFGPEGQVSVEFVEQNDMEAADPVSLVEAWHSLLIDTLEGLKVRSVNWRPEGECHS